MMKEFRVIMMMIFVMTVSLPSGAQQTVLGIDEMFRLAEENSKSLKAGRIAVEEAGYAVKVAKNGRLPSIEASVSASYIGDGWMSDRDFSNGQVAEMPHFGNNFSAKVSQVIYAGGAVEQAVKMSELQEQVARLQLQSRRQDVRFLLVGYYLDLYQLHNRKIVYEENIRRTELLLEEMRASYSQGTALKSDITRYELQLQDLSLGLTNTENRIRILNRQLTVTIGLDPQMEILPDTTLLTTAVDVRPESYWQDMKADVPSVRLAGENISMAVVRQNLARAGRIPQIGFEAVNNFNGPILIEVPPINKNFNYWYVGIGIKYNFDSLFKKNKELRQAKLATRQAEENLRLTEDNVSNAIHEACIDLDEAFVRLSTQEKSVQLAHENYDVVHYRYLNGLSLITDMLDAANIQLESELKLANARIGILYQYYLLLKTTGNL